jgi:hypothetical protein
MSPEAVSAIISAAGVIVAIGANILESLRSRSAAAIQHIMQLEAKFESPDFRGTRRRAASFLLAGQPLDDAPGRLALEDVLNFFELVAFLRHKRAVNADVIWHGLSSWLIPYFELSAQYVKECRKDDPAVYRYLDSLYDAVAAIDKRWRPSGAASQGHQDFLRDESRLFVPLPVETRAVTSGI